MITVKSYYHHPGLCLYRVWAWGEIKVQSLDRRPVNHNRPKGQMNSGLFSRESPRANVSLVRIRAIGSYHDCGERDVAQETVHKFRSTGK